MSEELPEDLADAAEAALDDLISNASAPDIPTQPEIKTRPISEAPPEARAKPPRPPPARAKSTVIELSEANRKRESPSQQRIPTFGGDDEFRHDDAHAFGKPVLPPEPPSRPKPISPAMIASKPTTKPPRGMTAELDEFLAVPLEVPRADSLSDLELDDDHVTARAASTTVPAPEPDAESSEPQMLRFAVFEEADHLAAARSAIVAAGHAVALNASSPSGAQKIADAIIAGEVDAILVGLPGGEAIVQAALALEPNRPLIIAAYSGKATNAIKHGVAIGADLATARPHEADRLAPLILAASRLFHERQIAQTAKGAELVLRAKLDEITDPEPRGLQPFEVFQRVLELEFKRARRFEYPLSVALFAIEVTPPPPPAGIRGILRARAGNALIHTIRDIDIATQLDHERFLVLLPYTDLAGATNLGRRVIAAVAEGEPVISSGRAFPPRVVGAVAQAKHGEQLSFAKLMKDATRALDQARRDGAELAVQP
jgi:two-component system, cell cycle response regulator